MALLVGCLIQHLYHTAKYIGSLEFPLQLITDCWYLETRQAVFGNVHMAMLPSLLQLMQSVSQQKWPMIWIR